jgi:hypothetical protein
MDRSAVGEDSVMSSERTSDVFETRGLLRPCGRTSRGYYKKTGE